jgi:uridine kinase
VRNLADEQTSVARAILQQLDHIPTVLILSQDSFYRRHTPEEIKLAFDNDLDLGEYEADSIWAQKADRQITLIQLTLLYLQR